MKTSQQNAQLLGEIENIVNGELGNSNTSHTYLPWANQGYTMGSFDFDLEAVTLTLEGSNSSDDISNENADWRPITVVVFGVTQETVSGEWLIDTPIVFGRLRFKRVTTNATNSFLLKGSKAK